MPRKVFTFYHWYYLWLLVINYYVYWLLSSLVCLWLSHFVITFTLCTYNVHITVYSSKIFLRYICYIKMTLFTMKNYFEKCQKGFWTSKIKRLIIISRTDVLHKLWKTFFLSIISKILDLFCQTISTFEIF